MFSVLSFISFFYLPFVCSIWSTCRFVVSGFRWMLALIDDDGCFGVLSFSVGGLSGLLSFFRCFLPLSCLCFKSLWLLSLCWSVRECWLIVLDLLSYVKDRLSVYGYTSSAFKFQKLVLVLFSLLVCVILIVVYWSRSSFAFGAHFDIWFYSSA